MLTFKSTRIGFLALLLLLIGANFFIDIPLVAFLLTGLIYLIILGLGSSLISSDFYLKAICANPNDRKEISITFDDGPNKEITVQVLDVLKEFKASASFFCIGKNISNNEHLLKRIDEEGHIIGNHTFSHAYLFDFYSTNKVSEELNATSKAIESVIQKKPKFFRPPYGVTNPAIASAVKETGYEVIGWSVRSLDTVIKDEKKLMAKISKNLAGGDIILFHDSNPRIVSTLRSFLEYANENGFKIVGLDTLIKKSAYA